MPTMAVVHCIEFALGNVTASAVRHDASLPA